MIPILQELGSELPLAPSFCPILARYRALEEPVGRDLRSGRLDRRRSRDGRVDVSRVERVGLGREPSVSPRLLALCSVDSFLSDDCPPMGIYETLYAFRDSFGQFMGTEGTHPWSQGFPLTTQLEGGPPLPSSVEVTFEDRFYPKAWGHPLLREAIAGALQQLLRLEHHAGERDGVRRRPPRHLHGARVPEAARRGPDRQRRVAGLPRHPDADGDELARRAVHRGERLPSAQLGLLRSRRPQRTRRTCCRSSPTRATRPATRARAPSWRS